MYDHDGDGLDTEFDQHDEAREVAKALRFGSHALATESVAAFVEGGHAVFTLVSKRSGDRFTYKVAPPPPSGDRPSTVRFFVSVLNGPNNEGDYAYLGCVYLDGAYRHGKRSRIPADAPSAKGFEWFWPRRAALPADRCEVHHMGTCGRCGRALTVPESITTGLGPVCAAKAAEGR